MLLRYGVCMWLCLWSCTTYLYIPQPQDALSSFTVHGVCMYLCVLLYTTNIQHEDRATTNGCILLVGCIGMRCSYYLSTLPGMDAYYMLFLPLCMVVRMYPTTNTPNTGWMHYHPPFQWLGCILLLLLCSTHTILPWIWLV
jgi:hypothetical protein